MCILLFNNAANVAFSVKKNSFAFNFSYPGNLQVSLLQKMNLINWLIFIALSVIWGSSFILMKEGLVALSAVQVASIRIVSSGLVLLPITFRHLAKLKFRQILLVFLSGCLGSLIPAYLFCEAETGLDSSTAGVLNALTPVFVVIFGLVFFQVKIPAIKIVGMIIAFGGSLLLYFAHPNIILGNNVVNMFLIVIATICYGVNVNLVQKYLLAIPSLHIAAIALGLCAVPAGLVLYFSGFFTMDWSDSKFVGSILYSCILGIFGTALASVIFYMLIKRAGSVFASMVTYCIPIVAFGWGLIYGEQVGWAEAACMFIILAGVYLANRKPKSLKEDNII